MSSTNLAEIIDALTAFYQQVAKHPHVGDAVLKLPPAAGWGDEIAVEALRASGKTEAVIDFLKHIPYFKGVKVTVVYDGTPVDYTYEGPWKMDPLNPIPGHCVYLTQGGSIEGLNLILDTEKVTITEYTSVGAREDYRLSETLSEADNWRAHHTAPAVEYFQSQTKVYARLVEMLVPDGDRGDIYYRCRGRASTSMLAQETGPLKMWHPDLQEVQEHFGKKVSDMESREYQHTADIYNCYLHHGWPDAFEKDACRDELEIMERSYSTETGKLLRELRGNQENEVKCLHFPTRTEHQSDP